MLFSGRITLRGDNNEEQPISRIADGINPERSRCRIEGEGYLPHV
jgi:hypothetical protein